MSEWKEAVKKLSEIEINNPPNFVTLNMMELLQKYNDVGGHKWNSWFDVEKNIDRIRDHEKLIDIGITNPIMFKYYNSIVEKTEIEHKIYSFNDKINKFINIEKNIFFNHEELKNIVVNCVEPITLN